jgi:hypothetical protein
LSIVQNAFALSSGRDSRYLVPTSAKYCSFVSQTTQLFIGSRKASNRISAYRFFLSLTLAGKLAFKKAIFWRNALLTGYWPVSFRQSSVGVVFLSLKGRTNWAGGIERSAILVDRGLEVPTMCGAVSGAESWHL